MNQIRLGLGRERLTEDAIKVLKGRLATPARSITPARVCLPGPALVQEFIRMTTGEGTTVSRVVHREEIPEAVASFLRELGLPLSIVLAPDKNIEKMPWDKAGLHVRPGRAETEDVTSVTPAFAGIAETGCLMLISGPGHPYTLNLMPENHIAVLKSGRIVATPEDAFDILRKEFGPDRMPRTALMATGPSRSADIGYSLQFGAHGPKRLHCILVD